MGYMTAWCPEDDDAECMLGDEIASNSGYAAYLEWTERLDAADYGHIIDLAENGGLYDPEGLANLEAELSRAIRKKAGKPTPDVLGVAKRLLGELQRRPAGTGAMSITDGTAGEGGDEEV